MRGSICAILFLLPLLPFTSHAQSYGLKFSSHEAVQEKRTSLNLTPSDPLCFNHSAEISFDLKFTQHREIYFGYIFRLITPGGQNIDLIYNQKLSNFNLIIGDNVSGTFTIDSITLYNEWSHLALHLEDATHEVSFSVNGQLAARNKTNIKQGACFNLFFGTNNFEGFRTYDIPPMDLKDIRVSEQGRIRYYWPLSESSGEECLDSVERKVARVINPVWIKAIHQNWSLATDFSVHGAPSVAFDPKNGRLFIVSPDSLYELSLIKGTMTGEKWAEGPQVLPPGNSTVFNPASNQLYNAYIDQKKVRVYDLHTGKWDMNFSTGPLTEFWQANKFYSHSDSSFYVMGGYGQLTYKNLVQRYSFPDKKWEIIKTRGDFFTPRYLAALGSKMGGDTVFVLGGYGSVSGDQMVNPKYLYELAAYSVKDRTFKTLYHFKEPDEPFCFANSLIVDPASDSYYALIYPNDKFNSALQLISGSLRAPGYQLLGDKIPYSFHDVKSFADLYYSPISKQLVAVTLYTDKEDRTEVKIYTIAFPPNSIAAAAPVSRSLHWGYLLLVPLVLGAGFLVFAGYRRNRKLKDGQDRGTGLQTVAPVQVRDVQEHSQTQQMEAPLATPLADGRSKIYFFGQFEVHDKDGNDLTKQYTPLLKEMFLLIAIYTLRSGKGISSEKLYTTLWRDKSNKDAQNNRSVNMVKLKGILDKLGNCSIVKEGDKWVFHYAQDQIQMDLAVFFSLVQMPHPGKDDIRQLLSIIHRGAFLTDTVYTWLDDIQSEISNQALDLLLAAIIPFSNDPEFLLEIAHGIFLFDPLNEEALKIKCKSLNLLGRHSLVKAAFEKFTREYQLMYGEEFQQSFQEILSN